jgi:hypothetical protein
MIGRSSCSINPIGKVFHSLAACGSCVSIF